MVLKPGTLPTPLRENIWQCLEIVLIIMTGEVPINISWVEAKDAAEHSTVHRTDPTTKNCLTQNVTSAKVEKPFPRSRKAEF